MSKIFVADKLKIRGTKTLSTIALILILTFSAIMAGMPTAKAHTPPLTVSTYAFISVEPNPVGVNQAAFVNFWIDKVAPTANSQYGDRWQNFKVTVTKPDGTTTTLGPFTSDDVGGAFTTYIPTAAGTYTFVFNFPGQTIAGANPSPISGTTNPQIVGDYYQPSTSRTVTLVVQQQQIQSYPSTPLPTGYWQRPIPAMNTAWYTISGNWLGGGTLSGGAAAGFYNVTSNFDPYSTAPNTGHIVWTKPYAPGGLIGGEFGGNEVNSNYYSTAQYENKFAGIVINGVLYWDLMPGSISNLAGWVAVDLRTGHTIWTTNTTVTLRLGQVEDYVSPNQFGGLAYLWSIEPTVAPNTGTTFGMYDAMSGNWILNMVNATTPTFVEGTDGSLLGYYIDTTKNTLNLWNATQAITIYSNTTRQNTNTWQWRPAQGASIPWSMGLMWSVPLVTKMTASNGTTVDINAAFTESVGTPYPLAISKIGDVILVDNSAAGGRFAEPGYIIQEGYSLSTGQLLWGPLNQTQTPWCRLSISSMGSGVYTIFTFETQTFTAYSTATGQKLWSASTAQAEVPWGYYITQSIIGYGNLYSADFSGTVNCFDLTTGALKWTYKTGDSGYETPYGVWPIANVEMLADGKLFVMGGHLYSPPLFHGGQLYAINATSGALVWSMPSFAITNNANGVLADGYLVVANGYDNQLYCYGTGQSATTVSAPDTAIPQGTPVLIQGTVTDQSPGQTSLGIPAAGTPAISDASMNAWMQYLYMQQPMPSNATGVPVTLTALDPNGNTQNIGTVTSDVDGIFMTAWTPPVPGVYKITATFAGSNSYFASHAETGMVVAKASAATVPTATPAPTATTPPTVTPTPSPSPQVTATPVPAPSSPGIPTTYIVIAVVAIIIVVAAAALALRRRK